MPLDDQIRQANGHAGLRMAGIEFLERHPAAHFFKVGLQISLLSLHALGPAHPRANGTQFLEVLISPLAVERNVGRFQLRWRRPLPGARSAVPSSQGHQRPRTQPPERHTTKGMQPRGEKYELW